MKYLLALTILLSVQSPSVAQADKLSTRVIAKEKMQEDFSFLRSILETTHPALYRYTSKAMMQQEMDSLAGLLNKDMAFYDYYQLLASLVADIRCAHTYIVPKQDIGSYFTKEIKMLPFEIIPAGNRLYITLNGTTDATIRPGYEIMAINGRPAGQVMQRLHRHLWADGYILSSKTSQVTGARFGMFYYMMVEQPDSFLLTLRDLEGKITEMKVPALANNVYFPQFFKNPVNKPLMALYKDRNKKDREKGWRLEMLPVPRTALLRINAFGGGKDAEAAAKKMRQFMDKNIAALKKNETGNLIIDLRDNGGGWDIQGVELFTYLMKDTIPVRYYRRKHTITDSSGFFRFSDLSADDLANVKNELVREPDGTFTVKEEYNEDLKLQYPKPERFTGNIYFLVNGGTGSSASEFAAVAHSHGLGVFIGDETGGAYEGDNGGSFLHFQLPNSGIAVGTPLIYYHNGIKVPAQKGRGVIPDYPVHSSLDDLLHARDPQLELALELIRGNKNP
jgi:hypothetical protein